MASGLRFVCTPPRLGDASPSYSPKQPNQPSTSSGSVDFRRQSLLKRHETFHLSSTFSGTPNNNRPTPPVLKFRLREGRSNYLKRKNSISQRDRDGGGPGGPCAKKRLKKNSDAIILPTRFLLGGNICDPLNLASVSTGGLTPQDTPKSSPMPTPIHKKEVEALIRSNFHDPLNLPNADGLFVSPQKKTQRGRRNRKKKDDSETSDEDNGKEQQEVVNLNDATSAACIVPPTVTVSEHDAPSSICPPAGSSSASAHVLPPTEATTLAAAGTASEPATFRSISEELSDALKRHEREKIVSPVLPQGFSYHHHPHWRNIYHVNNPHLIIDYGKQQTKVKKFKRKNKAKPKSYRPKAELFRYGNYDRYYGQGYRTIEGASTDGRISVFKKEWFENKDVLDIGCNSGNITIAVAKDFTPRVIIGVDVDAKLVTNARRNVRICSQRRTPQPPQFPVSLPVCRGPVAPTALTASIPLNSESMSSTTTPSPAFPDNIFFMESNYVLNSDNDLEQVIPEYDTILCLSVTKWVHLNWGDDGLKRMFKRIFRHLRPGGRLILEPQGWSSYVKKKGITEETRKNFEIIQLKPDKFSEYLLSSEVGFSTCELIGTPHHPRKGFQRPIYLLTKRDSC